MIVTVRADADPAQVRKALVAQGLWTRSMRSSEGHYFLVQPHSAAVDPDRLHAIEGVASIAQPESAHPHVDAQPPVVHVGHVALGGDADPVVMAGPCAVESEAHVHRIAQQLADQGVRVLRGGAFKPRTSPYAFQGHGEVALRWLRDAADRAGLKVVTEVMSPEDAPAVADHADLMQVGSRNMQNFPLLRAVGCAERPVLLKRGMAATVEEWLSAGEYLLVHGAPGVVFCERGVRSFDPSTRNLLDLGAVALLRHVHGLPVVVDPSHGMGRRDLVPAMARAALGAGACGLLVETHDAPDAALSDGPQALLPDQMRAMMDELGLGRSRGPRPGDEPAVNAVPMHGGRP
jgi:3-deoxy-7-phosphoheptulonate synthase